MKIIVSPSKTQKIMMEKNVASTQPRFSEQAQSINQALKKVSAR